MSATCRSCEAEILWAIAETSGSRMPLDTEPLDIPADGRTVGLWVLVKAREGAPIAVAASRVRQGARNVIEQGAALYVSHFATCPNAASHRRSPPQGRANQGQAGNGGFKPCETLSAE